jgi:hypothetical protein
MRLKPILPILVLLLGDVASGGEPRPERASPNVLIEVRIDTLVPKEMDELVTDESPVVDQILGTDIRGQAKTQGRVAMRLVPNNDVAMFELILRGTTVARTYGVNGPAQMRTTSHSDFTTSTRVSIDDRGLRHEPPQASAVTRSNLQDLEVQRRMFAGFGDGRSKLIERIARNKAEELQPQADEIAARHAEERYEQSMGEYVQKFLDRTNQPFTEKVRYPLIKNHALWEYAKFSSDTRFVRIRMLYADGQEPGAESPPPSFYRSHSFAFRLHESLFVNAGHMLLSGATLTDRRLASLMKVGLGEIPREAREYRLGAHMESWSVKLADEHPLMFQIHGGIATIGVRIREVTIAGHTTPASLIAVARYRLEGTPRGPRFVRLSKVAVAQDYAEADRPADDMFAFIERKANGFFVPEICFDGLVPPAGGAFDKYSQLRFTEMIVDQGWLALGFDRIRPVASDKVTLKPANVNKR